MFDDFKELLSAFSEGGLHSAHQLGGPLDSINVEDLLRAYFISKADLIASKPGGRMRDLADVEEIRQAEANT